MVIAVSSVAFNLITMKAVLQEYDVNYFSKHGLTFTEDMKNLAQQLRIIAVREWKANVDFYELFLWMLM